MPCECGQVPQPPKAKKTGNAGLVAHADTGAAGLMALAQLPAEMPV